MKPATFAYVAPGDLDEALAALSDPDREAKVLAGGQSLVPMMNFRLAAPELLVDLRRIEGLDRIDVDEDGALHIGAMVRQSTAAADARVGVGWPVLVEAIGQIAHPQIRNRGTVCGSMAHHDPAAELPAVAVALDALLTATGPEGSRSIPAAEFFVSYLETALRPGEILTEVVIPARSAGGAVRELAQRQGDFALVGAVACLEHGGAGVVDARIVLFGVGSAPVRARRAERLLVGGDHRDPVLLAAVRAAVADDLEPSADLHATADYRRETAAVMAERAVAASSRRGAR